MTFSSLPPRVLGIFGCRDNQNPSVDVLGFER
jgi:hypothetical protein